jgi:uncharacterized repeat protein (TIGR01451 family)
MAAAGRQNCRPCAGQATSKNGDVVLYLLVQLSTGRGPTMKNLVTFNAGRRGRALGVPTLAAGALVLLLLSLGSGQSAAMGPGMAAPPPAQGGVAPADIGVLAADDVSIVKSVSKPWAMNGDRITYTLTVYNGFTVLGGVNITVTDNLPAGLSGVTWSSTPAGGTLINPSTYVINGMTAQTGFITIAGQLTGLGSPTSITNTASVTAAGDTDTANNTSNVVTTTIWSSVSYLPLMFKSVAPPEPTVIFEDDFHSTSSGWITGNYSDCEFAYNTSKKTYRITAKKGGISCIGWNNAHGSPQLTPQFYGTFMVNVRRSTVESENMGYGFQFDALSNSSDLDGTRWAFVIYPNPTLTGCDKDKPYFWLTAQKYKEEDKHTDVYNNYEHDSGHECTKAIDTDQYDWNELAVVRDGSTIKVFIRSANDHSLSYSYVYYNMPALPYEPYGPASNNRLGWLTMRVEPIDTPVTAEFSNLKILSSVSDPW